MPLNPNGKVDKPALPFPDTAQLEAASRQSRKDQSRDAFALSPTQQIVRNIWLKVLPPAPQHIDIKDNFFDVGGHSILATRVVFEIRQKFAVDLPLGILFRQPSIAGLSEEIDRLRGGPLDMASRPTSSHSTTTHDYSADAVDLLNRLAKSYPQAKLPNKRDQVVVFLTGATGFLGAFLIRDLFSRFPAVIRIIAHVRAKNSDAGLRRIKNTCEAYGIWKDSWAPRLEVVTGALESKFLGLSNEKWEELLTNVDVVIHNGAMVRLVQFYYPDFILMLRSIGSILMGRCEGLMSWALYLQCLSVNAGSPKDLCLFPPPQFLTPLTTCDYRMAR
jgi:L-2-aminoadipate reductase